MNKVNESLVQAEFSQIYDRATALLAAQNKSETYTIKILVEEGHDPILVARAVNDICNQLESIRKNQKKGSRKAMFVGLLISILGTFAVLANFGQLFYAVILCGAYLFIDGFVRSP